MNTHELWWEQPGVMQGEAHVIDIITKENKLVIVLDQSLFYPEGGGQPGDQGIIKGHNGSFIVENTRKIEGTYCHVGKMEGSIQVGDSVTLEVDIQKRTYNSRNHSAGHLISALLEVLSPGHIPGTVNYFGGIHL